MSRRTVTDVQSGKPVLRQRGYVYQKGRKRGEPWDRKERTYGRYRIDVPGESHGQKEIRVALGYCRDEMDAMLKLQKEMDEAGVLDIGKVRERISPSATFRSQAAWWIQAMKSGEIVHEKKRVPIDPNTIASYSTAVTYLNKVVGDKPLAAIDNPEGKIVVAGMKSAGYSDKTIVSYFHALRKVVASALDEKFNPIHQRTWNLAAIGAPRVNPKKQRRPTGTPKEMTDLLSRANGDYAILYFFCLVTGLRIAEVVAVEIDKHLEPDCSILYVRQQREKKVNRVKPYLKTEAGSRDVDIHPDAAAILRSYIGNRKNGFLFQTDNGTMLDPGNIARDSLDPILREMGRKQAGTRFNIFRRFREHVLLRSDAREILIDFWMGHENSDMSTRYGKQLIEDVKHRKVWAEKVGLGFELPPSLIGLRGLQTEQNVPATEAA